MRRPRAGRARDAFTRGQKLRAVLRNRQDPRKTFRCSPPIRSWTSTANGAGQAARSRRGDAHAHAALGARSSGAYGLCAGRCGGANRIEERVDDARSLLRAAPGGDRRVRRRPASRSTRRALTESKAAPRRWSSRSRATFIPSWVAAGPLHSCAAPSWDLRSRKRIIAPELTALKTQEAGVTIFTYRDERRLFALIGIIIVAALFALLQIGAQRVGIGESD